MVNIDDALIDSLFVKYPDDRNEEIDDQLDDDPRGWRSSDELFPNADIDLEVLNFQFYLLGLSFSIGLLWVGCSYFYLVLRTLTSSPGEQPKSAPISKTSDQLKKKTKDKLNGPKDQGGISGSRQSLHERNKDKGHGESDIMLFPEDVDTSEKFNTAQGGDCRTRSDRDKTSVLIDEFESLICLDNLERKSGSDEPKNTGTESVLDDTSIQITEKCNKADELESEGSEYKRQNYRNHLRSIQMNMTRSSSALTVEEAATDLLYGDFGAICGKYIIRPSAENSLSIQSLRSERERFDRGKKNEQWRKPDLDSLKSGPVTDETGPEDAEQESSYSRNHQLRKSFSSVLERNSLKIQRQRVIPQAVISQPRNRIITNANLKIVETKRTHDEERSGLLMVKKEKLIKNGATHQQSDVKVVVESKANVRNRLKTRRRLKRKSGDQRNDSPIYKGTKPGGEEAQKTKPKVPRRKLQRQRDLKETSTDTVIFQEDHACRWCGKNDPSSKIFHKKGQVLRHQEKPKISKDEASVEGERISPFLKEKILQTNNMEDKPIIPSSGKLSLTDRSECSKNQRTMRRKRTTYSTQAKDNVVSPHAQVYPCISGEDVEPAQKNVKKIYPLQVDGSKTPISIRRSNQLKTKGMFPSKKSPSMTSIPEKVINEVKKAQHFISASESETRIYKSRRGHHKRRNRRVTGKRVDMTLDWLDYEGDSTRTGNTGETSSRYSSWKNRPKTNQRHNASDKFSKAEPGKSESSSFRQQAERSSETTSLLNYLMESASKMKRLWREKEKGSTSKTGAVRRKSVVEKFQPYKIPKFKQKQLKKKASPVSEIHVNETKNKNKEVPPKVESRLTENAPRLQFLSSSQPALKSRGPTFKRLLSSPSAEQIHYKRKPTGKLSNQTQVSQSLLQSGYETVSTEKKRIPKPAERLLHHRPRMLKHTMPAPRSPSRKSVHERIEAAEHLQNIDHVNRAISEALLSQGHEEIVSADEKCKVTNQNRRQSASLEMSSDDRVGAQIKFTKLKSKIPQFVIKRESAVSQRESQTMEAEPREKHFANESVSSNKGMKVVRSCTSNNHFDKEQQRQRDACRDLKRRKSSQDKHHSESRKRPKNCLSDQQPKYGYVKTETGDACGGEESKGSDESKEKSLRELFTHIKCSSRHRNIKPAPNKKSQSRIAAMIPLLMNYAQDPIIIIAPEKSIHELGHLTKRLTGPENLLTQINEDKLIVNDDKLIVNDDAAHAGLPVVKNKTLELKHRQRERPPSKQNSVKKEPNNTVLERHDSKISRKSSSNNTPVKSFLKDAGNKTHQERPPKEESGEEEEEDTHGPVIDLGPLSWGRLRHICCPMACRLCGTHNEDGTCEMGKVDAMTSHQQYTINMQKLIGQWKPGHQSGTKTETEGKKPVANEKMDQNTPVTKTSKVSQLKPERRKTIQGAKETVNEIKDLGESKGRKLQRKQLKSRCNLGYKKSAVKQTAFEESHKINKHQEKCPQTEQVEIESRAAGDESRKSTGSKPMETDERVDPPSTTQSASCSSEAHFPPSKSDICMPPRPLMAYDDADGENSKPVKTDRTVTYKDFPSKERGPIMSPSGKRHQEKACPLPGYLKSTQSCSAKRQQHHPPGLSATSKPNKIHRGRFSPVKKMDQIKQFRAETGDQASPNTATTVKPPPMTKSTKDRSFEKFSLKSTATISPKKTIPVFSPLKRKTVKHKEDVDMPLKIDNKREWDEDRQLYGSKPKASSDKLNTKQSGHCKRMQTSPSKLQTKRHLLRKGLKKSPNRVSKENAQKKSPSYELPAKRETRPLKTSKVSIARDDNVITKPSEDTTSGNYEFLQPPERSFNTERSDIPAGSCKNNPERSVVSKKKDDTDEKCTHSGEQMPLNIKQMKTSLERRQVTQRDRVNQITEQKNNRQKSNTQESGRRAKRIPQISPKTKTLKGKSPKIPQRITPWKRNDNTRVSDSLKPRNDNKQQSHTRLPDGQPLKLWDILSEKAPKIASSKSRVSLDVTSNLQFTEVECPEASTCRRTKIVVAVSNEAAPENVTKSKKETDWTTMADLTDWPHSNTKEEAKVEQNERKYLMQESPSEFDNLVKIEGMTPTEAEDYCLPDKLPKKIRGRSSFEDSESSLNHILGIDKDSYLEPGRKSPFCQGDSAFEIDHVVAFAKHHANKNDSFKYLSGDITGLKNAKQSATKKVFKKSAFKESEREVPGPKKLVWQNEMQKKHWMSKSSLKATENKNTIWVPKKGRRGKITKSDHYQQEMKNPQGEKKNKSDPLPWTTNWNNVDDTYPEITYSKTASPESKAQIQNTDPPSRKSPARRCENARKTFSNAENIGDSSREHDVESQSLNIKESAKKQREQSKDDERSVVNKITLSPMKKTSPQPSFSTRHANRASEKSKYHQFYGSRKNSIEMDTQNPVSAYSARYLSEQLQHNVVHDNSLEIEPGQAKSECDEDGKEVSKQGKVKIIRSILHQRSGKHDMLSRPQNESAQSSAEVHISWMGNSNLDLETNNLLASSNQLASSSISLQKQQLQSTVNNSDLLPLSTMWGFQDEAAALFSRKNHAASSQLLDTKKFVSHNSFKHEELLLENSARPQVEQKNNWRLPQDTASNVAESHAVSTTFVSNEVRTDLIIQASPEKSTDEAKSKLETCPKEKNMELGFPVSDRRKKQMRGGLAYRGKLRLFDPLVTHSKQRRKGMSLLTSAKSRMHGKRNDDKTSNNIKTHPASWMDGWLQGTQEVGIKRDRLIGTMPISEEIKGSKQEQLEPNRGNGCFFDCKPALFHDSSSDCTRNSVTDNVFMNNSGPIITVKFQKQQAKTLPQDFYSRIKQKPITTPSSCSQNVTKNNNQVQLPSFYDNGRIDSDEKVSENEGTSNSTAVSESKIRETPFGRRSLQDHLDRCVVSRSVGLEGPPPRVKATARSVSQLGHRQSRSTATTRSDESAISQVSFDWYKPSTSSSSMSSYMNTRRTGPGRLFNSSTLNEESVVTNTRRHLTFVNDPPQLHHDTAEQSSNENGNTNYQLAINQPEQRMVENFQHSTKRRVKFEFQEPRTPQLLPYQAQNSHDRDFSQKDYQSTEASMSNKTKHLITSLSSCHNTSPDYGSISHQNGACCPSTGQSVPAQTANNPQNPTPAFHFQGNRQRHSTTNISVAGASRQVVSSQSQFSNEAPDLNRIETLQQSDRSSSNDIHFFRATTPNSEEFSFSATATTPGPIAGTTGALANHLYQRPLTGFSYLFNETIGNGDHLSGQRRSSVAQRRPGSMTLRVKRPDQTTMVGQMVKMFEKKLQFRPPPSSGF